MLHRLKSRVSHHFTASNCVSNTLHAFLHSPSICPLARCLEAAQARYGCQVLSPRILFPRDRVQDNLSPGSASLGLVYLLRAPSHSSRLVPRDMQRKADVAVGCYVVMCPGTCARLRPVLLNSCLISGCAQVDVSTSVSQPVNICASGNVPEHLAGGDHGGRSVECAHHLKS